MRYDGRSQTYTHTQDKEDQDIQALQEVQAFQAWNPSLLRTYFRFLLLPPLPPPPLARKAPAAGAPVKEQTGFRTRA